MNFDYEYPNYKIPLLKRISAIMKAIRFMIFKKMNAPDTHNKTNEQFMGRINRMMSKHGGDTHKH
jgi:hypothetical protein